ncbi:hypothetical protein HY504_02655 [Candidatus Wolfebacteria bacterium]|nr:hypothetical protein [Candidatus Wolfebacteria bacterium]
MNKRTMLIIAAVLAVIAALLWWMYQAPETTAPVTNTPAVNETQEAIEADIQSDLDAASIEDLNQDFTEIDADLNNL